MANIWVFFFGDIEWWLNLSMIWSFCFGPRIRLSITWYSRSKSLQVEYDFSTIVPICSYLYMIFDHVSYYNVGFSLKIWVMLCWNYLTSLRRFSMNSSRMFWNFFSFLISLSIVICLSFTLSISYFIDLVCISIVPSISFCFFFGRLSIFTFNSNLYYFIQKFK